MKKILPALLLSLLCLSLLAGCQKQGAQQPPVPPVQEETPQENIPPVAVVLAVEENAGFDPYHTTSACNRLVLEFVLEPLFAAKASGEVSPILAESYNVSADGMTTTVTLKEGITFHDGTALTATTVADSVRLAQSGDYYAGRFSALADITVADSRTLVFTTSRAYECFPLLLDIPIVAGEGDRPVGTGQFAFGEGKLVKNAHWWGAARVTQVEEIPLHPVSTSTQLRESFQYGTVSALLLDPVEGGVPQNLWNFELWGVPTTSMQFVGFNLNKGVFQSRRLRQAVSRAVDRTAIVAEDLNGFGTPTVLATRPDSIWDYPALTEGYIYTEENLTDIVPEGLSATMIVCSASSQRVQSAQRIAEELTQRGLSTTVKALSSAEFSAALRNGNYDLYYAEVKLSSNLDLTPFFREGGAFAYGGLSQEEGLSDLCDLVLSNRGNTYDLQKTILENGLLCPVAFKTTALYVQRDALSAVSPNLNGWILH